MDYATMIKEIEEVASDALNEWEIGFIENVSGRKTCTDKQGAMIEKIYRKGCESPY